MDSELKSNLLIQILGALRNLCDMPATEKQLEESDIMSQLQLTLTQFYSDPEVGNVGLCSDPFSRWGRSFQPEGCCELQLFKKNTLWHMLFLFA